MKQTEINKIVKYFNNKQYFNHPYFELYSYRNIENDNLEILIEDCNVNHYFIRKVDSHYVLINMDNEPLFKCKLLLSFIGVLAHFIDNSAKKCNVFESFNSNMEYYKFSFN